MNRKYPVCSHCGHTLNPNLEDGCGKYALIGGEIYCEYCLQDYLKDEVDENPFEVAEAVGLDIFEVMVSPDHV